MAFNRVGRCRRSSGRGRARATRGSSTTKQTEVGGRYEGSLQFERSNIGDARSDRVETRSIKRKHLGRKRSGSQRGGRRDIVPWGLRLLRLRNQALHCYLTDKVSLCIVQLQNI